VELDKGGSRKKWAVARADGKSAAADPKKATGKPGLLGQVGAAMRELMK
jgi:hypothetical protein